MLWKYFKGMLSLMPPSSSFWLPMFTIFEARGIDAEALIHS